jgi:hypothetical protein
MSGIEISLITYLLTIIISLFVAVLVHYMVVILKKFPQEEAGVVSGNLEDVDHLCEGLKDETAIATVIAIAKARQK